MLRSAVRRHGRVFREREGARLGARAVLLPACAQPSPWPDRPCAESRPSARIAALRIARLVEIIREGIGITDAARHHKTATGPGLFAGSYDWHSCVHAHWALLCIARVRNDAELERFLSARFTAAAIARESAFLASNPRFELPYGRAWLLLVLRELARRARPLAEVARLESATQAALLDWLEASAYPEGGTPSAPSFTAQHDSWLFAYTLFALSAPTAPSVRARLAAVQKKKLEPARSLLAKKRHKPDDFLDLPAVQALADRIDGSNSRPRAFPIKSSPALFDPPLDGANAHSAGAALVRIWPYAVDAHHGDDRACSRFHARLSELFSRRDHFQDSFELVAHWVPQFMWMAIWLEAGRP